MLKTGKEYLEGLRDGRKVYIGKELVENVTTHPAYKNAAQTFASLYDRKREPENLDIMSFEAEGDRHSTWYLFPKTRADLEKRLAAHRRLAGWTHGLISPLTKSALDTSGLV